MYASGPGAHLRALRAGSNLPEGLCRSVPAANPALANASAESPRPRVGALDAGPMSFPGLAFFPGVIPRSPAGVLPCPLSPARRPKRRRDAGDLLRSEEHTSELQSLMRIPYAVF